MTTNQSLWLCHKIKWQPITVLLMWQDLFDNQSQSVVMWQDLNIWQPITVCNDGTRFLWQPIPPLLNDWPTLMEKIRIRFWEILSTKFSIDWSSPALYVSKTCLAINQPCNQGNNHKFTQLISQQQFICTYKNITMSQYIESRNNSLLNFNYFTVIGFLPLPIPRCLWYIFFWWRIWHVKPYFTLHILLIRKGRLNVWELTVAWLRTNKWIPRLTSKSSSW